MFADDLRKSILQAAIQGKLSKQLETDGDARQLLRDIQAEKSRLIAEKKIKPAPPLPPISPDEIPFEIPQNWCWVRLGDICNYGNSETILPKNMTVGKFLIDLEDIEKDTGRLINKKFFDGNNAQSSKAIFYKGYVLYGKLRPYLNKVLVADEDGYCTSEILPLNFGENIFNEYAKFFFMTPFFSSYATNLSCGTKMPRLRTEDGKKALFPLPPLAEQKRIAEKVSALLEEIAALAEDEKELAQLEKEFPRKMKASLLQAAIQGKLSEQLPTDGDARQLLRDIQAEKLRLIKEKKIKPAPPLPPIAADEVPFEIPQNWCWARLGDIGIFISGYTPKNEELCNAGKIPYFKVSDMNSAGNEVWLCKTNLYLKDDINKKIYEKNIIVYPKNGGAIFTNKRRILKQDSVVDLNTGGFKILGNIDLMYVFNYFLTIDFRFLYKGTALPTVDNKKLFERLFPLPPLAEQKRIVARLEELLQEIEF